MPYLGYIFILLICAGVIYLTLTRDRLRVYITFLYFAGLGMILTTTLAGPYLIGCDIHFEYYYAQLYSGVDVLPPVVGSCQGSTIGNTVLAPLLGRVVPLLWVYKLVFPMIFASVPVICYLTFRRWITPKRAFLAAFTIIIFPAFSMELPTVVRHMLTETITVTLIFLIFKSDLPKKYSLPVVAALGVLSVLSYYTVTIASLVIFGAALIVGLFSKYKRVLLLTCIISIVVTGCAYYPAVEEGAVATKLIRLYDAYAPKALQIPAPVMRVPAQPNPDPSVEYVEKGNVAEVGQPKSPVEGTKSPPYYKRLGFVIGTAIGLDWPEQTVWGKVFRILQAVFMLLIPIGLWKLRRSRKYLMLASGGTVLLALLLVPGVVGVLTATRVVHMALLVLAPSIACALKPKHLLLVLIPYFLFTSGFVFEVTQQPDIEEATIPYNYSLSNQRVDLGIGASITDNDYEVRQYILTNRLFPLYSDVQSADFVGELVGWRSFDARQIRTSTKLPNETLYVFVNDRAAQEGAFTCWNNTGRRIRAPFESFGLDINKNVVYQSGNSRVLKILQEGQ